MLYWPGYSDLHSPKFDYEMPKYIFYKPNYQLKKVTKFQVNSIKGEACDIMVQFDDKYWENCQYLKYYWKILFENYTFDKYFLYISVYTTNV